MRDLRGCPAKLEHDDERNVVHELGILVRGLRTPAQALQEDEGKADEDAHSAQEVPGFSTTVATAEHLQVVKSEQETRLYQPALLTMLSSCGLSAKYPTNKVEKPSAIWPARRTTPAATLSKLSTYA